MLNDDVGPRVEIENRLDNLLFKSRSIKSIYGQSGIYQARHHLTRVKTSSAKSDGFADTFLKDASLL